MVRKLLRLPAIADRTGIPLATLRWMRHCGTGPRTFILAGRVVADEADVEAWIEARAREAVGDVIAS